MHRQRNRSMHRRGISMGLTVSLAFFCAVRPLPAEPSAAELATQADKNLRTAERAMFSGQKEEADKLLKDIDGAISQLKSSDPSNTKLTTLQSKYDKLRRELDRRMGASSPASTPSRPASPPTPSAKPGGQASGARSGAADAAAVAKAVGKAARDVDYALGKIERLMAEDDSKLAMPRPAAAKRETADTYIAEAKGYLAAMRAKYGEAVDAASPEVKQSEEKIAAAEGRVESWARDLLTAEAKKAADTAAAGAQKEQTVARLRADAESMAALYKKYFAQLESIHGNSLFHGTEVEDAQKALAAIEEAEKALPDLAPEMGRLADLYGSRAMDINNTFFRAGYTPEDNVAGKFEKLLTAVARIPATRTASASGIATLASGLLSAFSGQLTDARIERMQKVKALLVVGQKIDPANPEIRTMLSKIDDQIAEAAEKMTAAIDAAEWPGHVKDFAGPGNTKTLAEEAVRFFRNHPNWKSTEHQVEVLAVAIRGPWQVAERDAFGRVISWRLPALVASTDERFRPRNIARVLEVSILAKQGAPDKAPKAPPFDGYWVGDNWMMRLNKL